MGNKLNLTWADLIGLLVIFLSPVIIQAIVVLVRPDVDTAWIMTTLTATIPIVGVYISMRSHLGNVSKQVDKVEENTNGGMKDRMKESVREILTEYGVTPVGGNLTTVPTIEAPQETID